MKDHPTWSDVVAFNGEQQRGLTKREYFAGVALQGILAGDQYANEDETRNARNAVRQADELIKALNE